MANNKKTISEVRSSKELTELTNHALEEMNNMTRTLTETGVSEAEAKLRVQQLYFRNLEMAGQPVAMTQQLLAELMTRIQVDRTINPEKDLLSDKYMELLDQMRKTITLLSKTQDKTVTHNVNVMDDRSMVMPKFIDVDEE